MHFSKTSDIETPLTQVITSVRLKVFDDGLLGPRTRLYLHYTQSILTTHSDAELLTVALSSLQRVRGVEAHCQSDDV